MELVVVYNFSTKIFLIEVKSITENSIIFFSTNSHLKAYPIGSLELIFHAHIQYAQATLDIAKCMSFSAPLLIRYFC